LLHPKAYAVAYNVSNYEAYNVSNNNEASHESYTASRETDDDDGDENGHVMA
jgi:hypothetical protein